jgi:putative transposase
MLPVKLTMQFKLLPTPKQADVMLRTMERFNAACGALAAVAFANRCANKVELQKLAYHDIRRDFDLGAQMTVRAIAKVVDAYKRDTDIQPTFRPHGATVYDQRIWSWKGADRVSILTNDGRQTMPWIAGAFQQARLAQTRGQADLIYRDGMFFLHVTIEVGDVPERDPPEYLGVDLGRRNIAADSDGETFCGAHNAGLRRRHARLRRNLRRKGTKSARRLLNAQRRKEARFASDLNHRISKAIVRKATDTGRGIAVEDVTHIRERTTAQRPQHRAHHSWEFAQLRAFLSYKAALAGAPLLVVDPRYTSQTCPACGRRDWKNRPTRDRFQCIRCGHAGPSDTISARNIAALGRRHAAERRAALALTSHLLRRGGS